MRLGGSATSGTRSTYPVVVTRKSCIASQSQECQGRSKEKRRDYPLLTLGRSRITRLQAAPAD